MPIRGFGGGGPRDRGDRGRGYFSGVRLFHGPMRFMFFGRPIIISSGKQVGFMFGFIAFLVMLVSTFAVFGNLSMYKEEKAFYESEREALIQIAPDYLDIIKRANEGESGYGKTRGSYDRTSYGDLNRNKTGYVYYEYQDVYSVVYEFMIGSGSDAKRCYGETLSTYYDVFDIPRYIDISYYLEIDEAGKEHVYSVETDFAKNYEIELASYEHYIASAQKSIKAAIVSAVILIIIILVIVALIILAIVKTIKNSKKQQELEDAKREAEVREAEAKAKSAEEELNRKYRYCEYCGAKFPDDEDKCPNCGSSHFIIKK